MSKQIFKKIDILFVLLFVLLWKNLTFNKQFKLKIAKKN